MTANTTSDTLYVVQNGDDLIITNDHASYRKSVKGTTHLKKSFKEVKHVLKWRKGIDKSLFQQIPVFLFPKKNSTSAFKKMISSIPMNNIIPVPKKTGTWTESELYALRTEFFQKKKHTGNYQLYLVRRNNNNFVITNDESSYRQIVKTTVKSERTFKCTEDIAQWRKNIDKILFRQIPVFIFPQSETSKVFEKMLLSFSKKQQVRVPMKNGGWTEKELLTLYSQNVHMVNSEKKGKSKTLQQQTQDSLNNLTRKPEKTIVSEMHAIQKHFYQVQCHQTIRQINKKRKLPLMSYVFEEMLLSNKEAIDGEMYVVKSKTVPSFFTNSKGLATFYRFMNVDSTLIQVETPEEAYMVNQDMMACLWWEGTPLPTHVPKMSIRYVTESFMKEMRLLKKSKVLSNDCWMKWMDELKELTTLLNKKFPMKSRALVQQLFGYVADAKQVQRLSFQKGSEKRMYPNGYVLIESDFAPPFAVRTKGIVSEFKRLDPLVKLTMIRDSEDLSKYIAETPIFVETNTTVRPRWYPANRTISLYGIAHEKISVNQFVAYLRRMASTSIDASLTELNDAYFFMKAKNSIEFSSKTTLSENMTEDLKILKKLLLRKRPLPKRPVPEQSIRLVTDAGGGEAGKDLLAGAQVIIGTHGELHSASMTKRIYSVESEMEAVLRGLKTIYDNGMLAFQPQKRIDVLFDMTVYIDALNVVTTKEMANKLTPSALGELYQYVTDLRMDGIEVVFHDIKDHSKYQPQHSVAHALCTQCVKDYSKKQQNMKKLALV